MTSQNSGKYIVQLRGANACGKSTAMRQYCKANAMTPGYVETEHGRMKVMRSANKVVIGWYKPFTNAEGCDASAGSKERLIEAINRLCDEGNDVICFEGFVYGKTYALPNRINAIAESRGYKYIAVLLSVPYTTELERLMKRNGGKPVNLNVFDSSYYGARKAFGKLVQSKVRCLDIDTSRIALEEMGGVIEEAIRRYKDGGNDAT